MTNGQKIDKNLVIPGKGYEEFGIDCLTDWEEILQLAETEPSLASGIEQLSGRTVPQLMEGQLPKFSSLMDKKIKGATLVNVFNEVTKQSILFIFSTAKDFMTIKMKDDGSRLMFLCLLYQLNGEEVFKEEFLLGIFHTVQQYIDRDKMDETLSKMGLDYAYFITSNLRELAELAERLKPDGA